MDISGRITKIIGIAAIFGMLVAPAMATTTLNDSLLVGNENMALGVARETMGKAQQMEPATAQVTATATVRLVLA